MTQTSLDRLRQLTQIDVQSHWHYCLEDLPLTALNWENWDIAPLNDKNYITWPAKRQVCLLTQKFTIPHHLKGYPLEGFSLRLILTWWAEDVSIFVNGELVQQGDLFDSSVRLLLSPSVTAGEEILVTLRLISPGHDIGGLMGSKLVYERHPLDPGFIADELTILSNYLKTFEPEKLPQLETALQQINWDLVSNIEQFDRNLATLRTSLLPLAIPLKQRTLNLLGHAHLDMAWLWPVNETWEAAQRTFNSVLTLQKEFPTLTFCHTSPALYVWIEKHRPDLFRAIQDAVKAQWWEVLGGMWVEPEVNIIAGESLVRQLLYGQRYIQEKFGTITKIAWLPDSFGFCWQLPQIFQQAGIDYFVTGKLHWNDTNKFPYGWFWWQSPDGTKLLTLISPPNVAGVMDTNPLIMSNYVLDWEQQTGLKDAFWLPGVGDHGGGPTRDMLQVANRWQQSPFCPEICFTTAQNYLEKITQDRDKLPIWNDELYLEFHRGCYTTHGDQKAFNRRCEGLLYQAELWSSLAAIAFSSYPYPKTEIETAWKKLLFNQFHDILPGTSINEVFQDANQAWQEVEIMGQEILQTALETIASQIFLPYPPHPDAQPILIFNSLNWPRSQVVSISIPAGNWEIYDLKGQCISSQYDLDDNLLFLADNIPSVGYKIFWLCPSNSPKINSNFPNNFDQYKLENEYLKVIINSETGEISSLFDKTLQQEMLKGAGNQLQVYQDQGQYWDAWNIDPNYQQYPLSSPELISIEYLEQGGIQSRIRVRRKFKNSLFSQDYILQTHSPILKIVTQVDWQEKHCLVKAAFPLNLENDYASYQVPCSVIQRSTSPQTPTDQAKWEVYGLHWADISDRSGNYGVSLLNDCKYGYDSQPDQLRLTLLRGATWPDPHADQGIHCFTYAIYPHAGTWETAKTVHHGYELNVPLIVYGNRKQGTSLPPVNGGKTGNREQETPPSPPRQRGGEQGELSFLSLQPDHLILMALKQSEDDPHAWILRGYEAYGQEGELDLEGDLKLAIADQIDVLEQPIQTNLRFSPWKILSFKLFKQ